MKKILILFILLVSSVHLHAGIGGVFTFPEGSSGEVQFESDGLFYGDSSFTYSTSTQRVTVSSAAITYLSVSTASVQQIVWPDGTVQTSSATAGGAGDVILASTQTHSGAKTFNSYTVFAGSVTAQNADFSIGGSTFVVAAGKVGIGTASPAYDLEIARNASGSAVSQRIINASVNANSDARLNIAVSGGNAGDSYIYFNLGATTDFTAGIDTSDSDKFKITNASTLGGAQTSITIDTSEKVGIGTQDPATKLHVSSGVLTLDGSGAGFSNSGYMVYVASAITIADNGGGTAAAYTLTPIAAYNKITCSDANGCDITMGESGIVDGTVIRVVNVGSNVANFADTSGVSEIAGAFAAGQWDFISLMYTTDRWSEISRSNN
jgi:hypothetical protein